MSDTTDLSDKIEGLREHIFRTVEKQVNEAISSEIKDYFDGLLVQEIHNYMDKRLDKYIQDMIRNNLDAALDELYSEFDLERSEPESNEGSSDHIDRPSQFHVEETDSNDLTVNTTPAGPTTKDEPTETTYNLTEQERVLLAYCQYYETHTGQVPQNQRISKTFGLEFYSNLNMIREGLVNKGWMVKKQKNNTHVFQYQIVKGLPDHEQVLMTYFDDESEWRLQEDPAYE